MARKIYLMNEESLVEFFKRPVRYLKQNTSQKESAFEKPYLDESYRRMHFNFPNPDWPQIPPGGPLPPLPPLVPPDEGKEGVCAITCYEPTDCDEPIWCHPSIWTGQDPDCTGCQWTVQGAFSSYDWHSYVGGGGDPRKTFGIDIEIDEALVDENGVALVSVSMQDIAGNLCGEDIEVTCKVCPPDVAISYDDATSDDTIAQENTATVAVLDGLGPYTWEVAGTGFSFASGTTTGLSNTLSASDQACGTATITVTDYCGGTATGYVRCTTGNWCEIAFTECTISGAVTEGDDQTRIQDQYKLTEVWTAHASCSGGGCNCAFLANDCDRGEPDCHATMGCEQCLTHAYGYCGSGPFDDTACGGSPAYCCCEDGDCDTNCSKFCSRTGSKLEEWKCNC